MDDGLTTAFRRTCEQIATRERYHLGLKAFDPLLSRLLIEAYQAKVYFLHELPDVDPARAEEVLKGPGWSSNLLSRDPLVIVHNPTHSPARQEANLMHEFAHYLLNHPPAEFNLKTNTFTSSQQHENEAKYLGSCLQIPKRGLQWAKQRGMNMEQIASYFGSSMEIVQWRSNATRLKIPA